MKKTIKPTPIKDLINSKNNRDEENINLSLSSNIDKKINYIKDKCNNISDLVIKQFDIRHEPVLKSAIIYIENIVDDKTDILIQNMLLSIPDSLLKSDKNPDEIFNYIKYSLYTLEKVNTGNNLDKMINKLVTGCIIVVIDGVSEFMVIDMYREEKRKITRPESQTVIRGPKDSFIEDLNTNINLLRQRIKSEKLKLERYSIGRVGKTNIVITYLEGIAIEDLIIEVRKRIERIDIDLIVESSNIEQLIEDNTFSPFPTIVYNERPDELSLALNEGRIGILVDGSPFALILPVVFTDFLRSPGDLYQRFWFPIAIRLLRLLAVIITLLGPSLYVALTTFHQDMIPADLLINIAGSRSGVPFPAFLEALLMEITFEAIREAGLRLPKATGQTVSILGALIVGETAIRAGLVSHAMVIVVALTGIASFIIPAYNFGMTIRLLRFGFITLAGSLGMFGIALGILALLIHLVGLRSFAVPYLTPITPFNLDGFKNYFLKAPEWLKHKRPSFISDSNLKRIKSNLKPEPPEQGDN